MQSPLGIVDIALGNTAWSAKTLKSNNPYSQTNVRLISGRNSPIFSSGSQDFFADVQETGNQVLSIWNSRLQEATQDHPFLRTIVLLRNMDTFQFKVFELSISEFDPADYEWSLNPRGNFIGRTRRGDNHAFTWQPHGSQLTIIRQVSASARSFRIRRPHTLDSEKVLEELGYDDDWLTLLGPGIISISIASSPISDDTYRTGETIDIAVTFSSTVLVTGIPQLKLRIGRRDRMANYHGGSGTAELTFRYALDKPDNDRRGVGLSKDSLDLNGGSIKGTDGRDATLTHARVVKDPKHKVKGT